VKDRLHILTNLLDHRYRRTVIRLRPHPKYQHRLAPWEAGCEMARVYADVNQQMPRSYWDYDSVNITWGVLENYEVVRKIGQFSPLFISHLTPGN
jgi:hypothetical protein